MVSKEEFVKVVRELKSVLGASTLVVFAEIGDHMQVSSNVCTDVNGILNVVHHEARHIVSLMDMVGHEETEECKHGRE